MIVNEKECPNGCDNGFIYNLGIDAWQKCTVCLGAGWIDLDEICACGGPCVARKTNIAFCGKEECFIEKGRILSNFYSFSGSYGPFRQHHQMEMLEGYE